MRKLLVLSVIVLTVMSTGIATNTAHAENTRVMCPGVIKGVTFYRNATWKWQGKLGIAQSKISVKHFHSCDFARWAAHKWMKQASLHRVRYVKYRKSLTGFPPHHSLWVCIGSFEGGVTSVNPNGHYGMLQMTYNWMGVIKGRASDYSQAVQEWAAEKAWAANGYSYSFLYQQWFAWDNADGCYGGG